MAKAKTATKVKAKSSEVEVGEDEVLDMPGEAPPVVAPKSIEPKAIMPVDSGALKSVFEVSSNTSNEDIMRYASAPGVELRFNAVDLKVLDESFVAMLPAQGQKAYWMAFSDFESRRKLANQALFETPNVVDPFSKLLDGPKGSGNPLVRDQEFVQEKIGRDWYITWRVEGGQGDLEAALRSGFKVMRRPKDKAEESHVDPREWSGERWTVRDGTLDRESGEHIYNVMVYIRARAQKDHVAAMSMVSHNRYATNKQQFVEGIDNISRDMLSSKERITVADLDEVKAEEHTVKVKSD
ncbi:MAG: hypothetical protein WC324_02135 [Candidatus Omnitrophota bacterium]|jgi:hypothetical protein